MKPLFLLWVLIFLPISTQKALGQEDSKINIDFQNPHPVVKCTMGSKVEDASSFSFSEKQNKLILKNLKSLDGLEIKINDTTKKEEIIILDKSVIQPNLNKSTNSASFEIRKLKGGKCDNCGEFVGQNSLLKGKLIRLPLQISVMVSGKEVSRFSPSQEETGESEMGGTTPKVPIKNMFTPDLEDYPQLMAQAKAKREQRINTFDKRLLRKKVITYDFSHSHDLSSRPDGRKLMAGINENVVLEVININPYLHTVLINNTPVNLHTEGTAQFSGFITPPTAKAGTASDKDAIKDKTTAQDDEKKEQVAEALINMDRLVTELKEFYAQKVTETSPDIDLLAAETDLINRRISHSFGIIELPVKEALLAKGNELVQTITDEKMRLQYAGIIKEAAEWYSKVTNISYTATSGVIQPGNNDMLRLDLTIRKGDQQLLKQPYEVMLRGGWKIDFSTGIFLTDLIDRNFTTQKVTARPDTVYFQKNFVKTDSILAINPVSKDSIIRNDGGPFAVGLGLLAHLYPRTGYRTNMSVTSGFIIGTDSRIKYLLGGSLLLGYEQRLILSGGVAIGQVKRLGAGLKEGGYFTPATGQSTSVPTRDYWAKGWFFSITYNLGGTGTNSNQNKK